MITTQLRGGTGNQMFQFAMGLSQAERYGCSLRLDIGSFDSDRMREFTLGLFPRIAGDKNIEVIKYDITTIHEDGMPYNEMIVDSIRPIEVLKGYWQTEKYFEDPKIQHKLRWYFEPAPLTLAQRAWLRKIEASRNPTFLTVRRTDYVGNTFHGELPLDYYERALQLIVDKTGEQPDIFIFSDEPDWCCDNFHINWPFHVAGTYDRTIKGHLGREDADLYMMSRCRNAVMANSSFSWWGAWLGERERKFTGGVVVAPQQWFGPTSSEDPRDIVPDRWFKI